MMIDPTTVLAIWATAKVLDSKGGAKLIECLKDSAGWVLAPTQLKRLKRAEVEANIEADLALDGARRELEHRAVERLRLVESRRQNNLEQTLKCAFSSLPPDSEVSDESVDPDWMASFFTAAQDVSHEYVRSLFGRILAKEVGKPGQFSRRTLDVLRLLESSEAELFQQVCGAAVHDADFDFVGVPQGRAYGMPLGISDSDLRRLEANGLLHSQPAEITFSTGATLHLPLGERIRVGRHSGPITFITFTAAGQKVASVVAPVVHPQVREKVIFILKQWLLDLTIIDTLPPIEVRTTTATE